MNISTCMKTRIYTVTSNATVKDAVESFIKHHIGTLPVIDEEDKLVGVILIRDLVSKALPDFVSMLQNIDYIQDFGAAELSLPDELFLREPVTNIMRQPIFVEKECSLLRATAMIKKHDLPDLPVVDNENRLLGIASLVDIGTLFLKSWT